MDSDTKPRYLHFRFRIKDLYSEREIESLLEVLERRGASYAHLGEGWYEVQISSELLWVPFYKTMRECDSVQEVNWFHPPCAKCEASEVSEETG